MEGQELEEGQGVVRHLPREERGGGAAFPGGGGGGAPSTGGGGGGGAPSTGGEAGSGAGSPGVGGGGDASSGYGIEINFNDMIMPTIGGSSLPLLSFPRLGTACKFDSLAATGGSIQDLIIVLT